MAGARAVALVLLASGVLTQCGCSSMDSAGCLPGKISVDAPVQVGGVLHLRQAPAACELDFTDGQSITIQVGAGRPLSAPSVRKTFSVASDGSFAGTMSLPEEIGPGSAYVVAIGGYDPHTTGDRNLPATAFRITPK